MDIINLTTITVTTSSTSKKQLNLEDKKDKYINNNKNKFSDKIKNNILYNRNFQTIESKDFIVNTNRSNIKN